jgi:hypothetical protein
MSGKRYVGGPPLVMAIAIALIRWNIGAAD